MSAEAKDVEAFLLALGVALTMTGDAVSEIQGHLRKIAGAYGYEDAHISVFPTLLLVSVESGRPAGVRTIDSVRQLQLDQATEVIAVAHSAEVAEITPREALKKLERILVMKPRFNTVVFIASHAVLTLGLGLLIRPAPVDLWVYLALGALVGAMRAWARRFGGGGYLLPMVAAAVVSAVAFLAHGGNEAASLRLTIPPLVTFIPGALLTMATVDLAMGETVTGASRFVAGLLQLALLAIAIVVGAQLVGNPHSGPVAGASAHSIPEWTAWLGVLIFGVGIYFHNSAPRGSLPWLLIVLFAAWIGQVIGKHVIDASLSGFLGAMVMVPVAHAVGRARTAPPPHVMFLPAFWLLVPGTIGLIGITELVGKNEELAGRNLAITIASIPSVALGILAGTMVVRGFRAVGLGSR